VDVPSLETGETAMCEVMISVYEARPDDKKGDKFLEEICCDLAEISSKIEDFYKTHNWGERIYFLVKMC
jgi:hypothetical protein